MGDVLGLTPKRTGAANMKEAVAEQLAMVAARRHDRQSDVHQKVKEMKRKGKKGGSKRKPKPEKSSKSKTRTLRKTRGQETGAASAAKTSKRRSVISPPVIKARGSERLSFWGRDHKVTPRTSLEALFITSESKEVSDEGSTPMNSSEENEPNTQDNLFIKQNDETTSDGEYAPTDEALEFNDSEGEALNKREFYTPVLSAEKRRALKQNPELSPAYFESKDNEGEGIGKRVQAQLLRQRTPEYGTASVPKGKLSDERIKRGGSNVG